MEETKERGGRPPLYVRPPTPPPGSTPPPADNIMDSRPPPPPLPALTLGPSQESLEIEEDKKKEQNLIMFKKKHLFVELHELRGDEWHETKRYNLGVPRCCGAFTPWTRLVSIRRGRGWFLFRVRGRSDRLATTMLRAGTTTGSRRT